MLMTALVSVALAGAPKVDERLVGTWLASGAPFMTLSANGTGRMEDEGKLKWSADGKTLVVTDEDGEADKVPYTLSGSTLTLSMGGMSIPLTRAGAGVEVKKQGVFGAKAAKANRVSEEEADREALAEAQVWLQKNGQGQGQPAAAGAGAARGQEQGPAQPAGRAAGADQLSQLLLSSAWCSFTYNQHTGASSTSRYQFSRDGTWSTGGRSETYNTGTQGTVAGQYDSSGRGRWEVRNGTLFLATPDAPQLQPVTDLRVSRNSNGSPIINADGREFAACN